MFSGTNHSGKQLHHGKIEVILEETYSATMNDVYKYQARCQRLGFDYFDRLSSASLLLLFAGANCQLKNAKHNIFFSKKTCRSLNQVNNHTDFVIFVEILKCEGLTCA